jgi:Membrane protease subunits, stomatin/prohibitin homologs
MKRRGFVGGFIALLLCCTALAGGASAQGGGGRRGGGMMGGRGGGVQMLRIPEVQKELKMTPEQVGKLDAKQDEVRQAMQGLGGGNPAQLSPEERQKRADKVQEIQTKAVASILDAEQMKRYRQLELQQQGPAALARADVAAELKLTDEQKKKIADAQRQGDEDRRAAGQGANFQSMSQEERTKWMAKMQDIQKATGDKILAILTEEQKAQWKGMLGAPFTFPAPTFGGGRRPGA